MRSTTAILVAVLALAAVAQATTHFEEKFADGDAWRSRWVESKNKAAEGTAGEWKHTAGKWYSSPEAKGIQTTPDARFFQLSAKVPTFTNQDKPLVLQYAVKMEEKIDCGGAYIKIVRDGFDPLNFSGDTDYAIMFGPDICGAATRKIHTIFNYKGQNLLWKKQPQCETDALTHVYTLIVRPDNTYSVLVDNEERESGSLYEDWDFLPPREIKDPAVEKPADWVDEPMMDDPEDVKPADWDDEPALIPDEEAVKPSDWDDEDDGEWERPMISNPAYKGKWRAKRVANPAYKGTWEENHPRIPNPDFVDDKEIYVQKGMGGVGFELWQVKSGTIFSNIYVGDDVEEAKSRAQALLKGLEAEKTMWEEAEAARLEEERARMEEMRAQAEITDAEPEGAPEVEDLSDDERDEL